MSDASSTATGATAPSFTSSTSPTSPASGAGLTDINSTLQTIVQNLSQLLAAINIVIEDAT
jgi:hypothetical protein